MRRRWALPGWLCAVGIGLAGCGPGAQAEPGDAVATVGEDQAPTRSVALVSPDGDTWTHRDLEVDGDVSGQLGTDFAVRRTGASRWELASRPAVTAPGLAEYPDDPSRAIWNQLAATTGGDLVAVGSPDRQHLTAQRFDHSRDRWTTPRVVYDAGAPVCRRSVADSGVLQGATFRLRLRCEGHAVVLRSRTGATWTT